MQSLERKFNCEKRKVERIMDKALSDNLFNQTTLINPLVSITASLYFEVKNAPIFGGEGSVGYTSVAFFDVQHIEALGDDFITTQKKITCKMLGVSPGDVSLISKEAYTTAMEGSDDEWEDWEE